MTKREAEKLLPGDRVITRYPRRENATIKMLLSPDATSGRHPLFKVEIDDSKEIHTYTYLLLDKLEI